MSQYIMPISMFDTRMEAIISRSRNIAEIAIEELKTPQSNLCLDDEALAAIDSMFKDLDKRLELLQIHTLELANTIENLKIAEQKDYAEIYG
jgi:hypothetical protein